MGLRAGFRNSAQAAGEILAAVRRLAHAQRELVRVGGDPIVARKADRSSRHAQKLEALTLARAACAYHERVIEPNRTTKHALQWINTLEQHVPQEIWYRVVDRVTPAELLDSMVALNAKAPETSYRVRQRIETVFDDLQFRGECLGNPAAGSSANYVRIGVAAAPGTLRRCRLRRYRRSWRRCARSTRSARAAWNLPS